MPEVFDWRRVADPRGVIRCVAAALRAGRVVAFPTETGYHLAAGGLSPEAVGRIGVDGIPLTVAVGGAAQARDWAPGLSRVGQRLARRFWPGPLTLASGEGVAGGLASRLPEVVRRRVCPDGAVRLRMPAHEAVLAALRELAGPLVLAPVPGEESAPAQIGAHAAVQAAADRADLIVDDGPNQERLTPTVVHTEGETWTVLQEGAVAADQLHRQAATLVVFVCTGNTCRSPLAEALCKARLAERLGCTAAELPARGFLIVSAGLSAMPGGPAAEEAVEVARAYGADLSGHRSRPLTPDLAAQADYLVVMTQGHLHALLGRYPRLSARPRLLSPEGDDLADPIGYPRPVYEECGRQIWSWLDGLAAELQPPASIPSPND